MARRYEMYCMYSVNICILYPSQMVVPVKPQGDHTFNCSLQLCLYNVIRITATHVTSHSIYGPSGFAIFFRNRLINGTIFGNRRIDTKYVLIFCTNFIRNSFISGRIERDITVNVRKSSCKMPDIFIGF
jgi:hypothetical protein